MACSIPFPSTAPQACLRTSSTSSLKRMSKISCPIQGKIICALSNSKHVGKLFARRMYLVAIAKGFDGCIRTLDSFMAVQWKLLIMSNMYISLTPFVQKSKALFKERPQFWTLDTSSSLCHTFMDRFVWKQLWHFYGSGNDFSEGLAFMDHTQYCSEFHASPLTEGKSWPVLSGS